ncbi:MAG: putative replicase [Cressdnaviricota sp.]|nr:MAG: putative replicase [Cressdnaviricota sp.]
MTQQQGGSVGGSLGSPPPADAPPLMEHPALCYTGYYGITISLPHTTAFLNMPSVKQAKQYRQIWNVIKNALGVPFDSDFSLEYNQNGQVHLHGYIQMVNTSARFVNGAISDIAKAIHLCLPKKFRNFNEKNLFPNINRYRCPSHVIQYYDPTNHNINDPSSIEYWKAYIKKDIGKYTI